MLSRRWSPRTAGRWLQLSGREVHSALSLVSRATSILTQEIFDYANFDDYEFLGKSMGFRCRTVIGEQPMFFLPGVLTTMCGPCALRIVRRRARRCTPAYRAVLRRQTDRVQDVHGGAWRDGRGSFSRRGCARRGYVDHDGAHHPAHRSRRATVGVPARRQARCAPWWSRANRVSS